MRYIRRRAVDAFHAQWSIDEILRSIYLDLKINVDDWRAIDFSSLQPMEFIECEYDGFCREIDYCISEVLIAGGDPAIIRDYNSLKDRVKYIRRRAVAELHGTQIRADTKIMADAEMIADTKIMAEAKMMADAQIIVDAKMIAEAKMIADAEIKAEPKMMAD